MTNLEQREKIKTMLGAGHSSMDIAKAVGCSVHTVRKWKYRIKKGLHFTRKWVVPVQER
jgi:transposase